MSSRITPSNSPWFQPRAEPMLPYSPSIPVASRMQDLPPQTVSEWHERMYPQMGYVVVRNIRLEDAAAAAREAMTMTAQPLYGEYVKTGEGDVVFKPSARFGGWLQGVQNFLRERKMTRAASNPPQDEKARSACQAPTGQNNPIPTPDMRKREANGEDAISQRPTKRSRVGAALQRTISHLNLHRQSAGSSVVTTSTTTAFPSTPLARTFSPFSVFSRCSGTMSAGSVRTLKICLVGDPGAGKSTFLNWLVTKEYNPYLKETKTSYSKTILWTCYDKTPVNIEIWDIPGTQVRGNGICELSSNFFHAAVICMSLEDKVNVKGPSVIWRPKLNMSLHDQPVYLLGMKSDTDPKANLKLPLAFLPQKEVVTRRMAESLAKAIAADHYVECSTLKGENVEEAWGEIINRVLERVVAQEKSMKAQRKSEQRIGKAVSGMLSKVMPGKDKDKEGK